MKKIINKITVILFVSINIQSIQAKDLIPDVAVLEKGQHIVINLPQLRLFVFEDGSLQKIYPIAIGKNRTQTPAGEFKIGKTAQNPTWIIPLSIRKERELSGLPNISSIPPGPNNPLGPVFVRFGDPKDGYGIHGTNVPSSVPGVRSHGCVRLKSPNALDFAKIVNEGSIISIVYQQYSLNQDEAGQLWLRAYGNPYKIENASKQKLQDSIKAVLLEQGKTVNQGYLDKKINQASKLVCLNCEHDKASIQGKLTTLAWMDGLPNIRELREYIEPITPIPYSNVIGVENIKQWPQMKKPLWDQYQKEPMVLDSQEVQELLE